MRKTKIHYISTRHTHQIIIQIIVKYLAIIQVLMHMILLITPYCFSFSASELRNLLTNVLLCTMLGKHIECRLTILFYTIIYISKSIYFKGFGSQGKFGRMPHT